MRALLIFALLLAAYGAAGRADLEEATDHGSLYCRMTALHGSSGGDLGWPPYDPRIECG